MLNSTKSKTKSSHLESAMNRQIVIVFIFQLIFCLFSSLYGCIWYVQHSDELSYLEIDPETSLEASFIKNLVVRYGNWLIIFQNFVPISLIVTVEMVKFIQGIFISSDQKMKSKVTDNLASVNTSNLNEELGQVEYIFSDKTGTLTCNFMQFKKITIDGQKYGEDHSLSESQLLNLPKVTNVDFLDSNFFRILSDEDSNGFQGIKESLLAIALCHTILVEKDENGEIVYNASSPDELALVNWARFCGCEFQGVDGDNRALVKFLGKTHKFEVLNVLEFNSIRF